MKGKRLWAALLAAAVLSRLLSGGGLAQEERTAAELVAVRSVPVRGESVPPGTRDHRTGLAGFSEKSDTYSKLKI